MAYSTHQSMAARTSRQEQVVRLETPRMDGRTGLDLRSQRSPRVVLGPAPSRKQLGLFAHEPSHFLQGPLRQV